METMHKILDQLTGKETFAALTRMMAENFEDFAEDQKRYDRALCTLREALGDAAEAETEAIRRQTLSNMLYFWFLGIKENLDHFNNPTAGSFLDADFETFLREKTARNLPEYITAQEARSCFHALLSPAQKEYYGDITAYAIHLETVVPKLAHYYGYLLGNELLPWIVPGYQPDMIQTIRYRSMLESYFGIA